MMSPHDLTRATYAFISHSPATYPLHEPDIDNAPLARRKRRRTSANELQILHSEFRRCPKPPRHVREEIAERVGMSEKAVQIWFQNRRQSSRRAAQQNNSFSQAPTTMDSQKLYYTECEPALSSTSSVTTSSSPGPDSPLAVSFAPLNLSMAMDAPVRLPKLEIVPPPLTRTDSVSSTTSKGVLTPTNTSFANVMSMAAITNSPTQPPSAAPPASPVLQPRASATSASAQLRLTMSSDGKAHVVLGTPNNKENAAAPETVVEMEYECVQNLLRLRSGTWL